ncbi:MAG: alpha/beta fold hydrolase [Anaerolineae bacterium]
MSATNGWVNNQGVRLHYLDNLSTDQSLTPIVFIPGAFGSAENYLDEFRAFAPRRCIAISLRGRGRSDAPQSGYTLQDHAADITAVINKAHLSRFVLMAFSMGVPYAIQYCSQHSHLLAGFIIADYPAQFPELSPEWVDRVLNTHPDKVKPHVVKTLFHEASATSLWHSLGTIKCPTLILRI